MKGLSNSHILIILLLIQLGVCLPILSQFPISLDEPFSIYHSQHDLSEFVPEILNGNNSPLHFIALHFWIKLFGISAFAVRSLSVLFSLITIIAMFKLGQKFLKKEFLLILICLFIFSRWNHWISVEARMYSLYIALFSLIILDFYRFLFEKKSFFWRLIIWNTLLVYTHYLGGIVLLCEAAVFIFYFRNHDLKKWGLMVLTGLITIALFIPGLKYFLARTDDFAGSGTWVPPTQFVDIWENLIKLFNNQFTFYTLLGGIILIFFINRSKETAQEEVKPKNHIEFFILWTTLLYLLMLIISLTVQPIFFIKYLVFISIPFFFIIAMVLQRITRNINSKYSLILIIPFLMSFKIIPDTNRETDILIEDVKEKINEHTLIVFSPPFYDLTIAYHYDQTIFQESMDISSSLEDENIYAIYSFEDIPDGNYESLIYIDFQASFLYPENNIFDELDRNFIFLESSVYAGNFYVYEYSCILPLINKQ